jgi:nucleotide-binding universal stress UspA family protein/hemerythrin-like domain-containing protein
MYRHLLVPIDDTALAIAVVGKAVEFARTLGARITFFHAGADYGATATGALLRTIEPQLFVEESAGATRGILAKAEVAARAAGVPFASLASASDRPHEAILEAARQQGCDLIFMASHGHHGIDPRMLRSQLRRLLSHTTVAVLVAKVESNAPASAKEAAIDTIRDEHRSIAAVVHGLQYLVKELREKGTQPDDRLLRAILHYLKAFPETLHHPKEEAYLFRRLRMRTLDTHTVIAELERQHEKGGERLQRLEDAVEQLRVGTPGAALAFADGCSVRRTGGSMDLEETVLLPAAEQHLTEEDWAEVADAFATNDFGDEPDAEFHKLFSRILNMAPATVIGGQARPPEIANRKGRT